MRRFGKVIGLRTEKAEQYVELHRAVWPSVLAANTRCHVRNYSIYRYGDLLFHYFEYVGQDYEADRARLLADPEIQQWLALCSPCLRPIDDSIAGTVQLDEIFHLD